MFKCFLPLLAFVILSIPQNKTLASNPQEPELTIASVFIEVASASSVQASAVPTPATQIDSDASTNHEALPPLMLTVPKETAVNRESLPDAPSASPSAAPAGSTAASLEPTPLIHDAQPVKTYQGISVGDTIQGELTHYCVCKICCGKENGITASGLKIKNGMEDPRIISCNWLPFGATVRIHGEVFTVSDRGGSGLSKKGRVDVFTPAGHRAALTLGRQRNVPITILSLP